MSRIRLTASIVHDRSVPCLSPGCAEIERPFARWLAAQLERGDVPPEHRESADALLDLIETVLGERHARAVREMEKSGPVAKVKPDQASPAHNEAIQGLMAGGRR